MKKIYFLAFALLVAASAAKAQSFSKGDGLLNLGIGVGSPYFASGYSSSLPVNPSISYEQGITDAISIGGQVSYASSKYTYFGETSKQTAIYVGARGAYHFGKLWDLGDKIDLYGGAGIGYVISSYDDNFSEFSGSASAVGVGAFAGGRYYFAGNTSVYGEAGYQSLALLNVGISFKF